MLVVAVGDMAAVGLFQAMEDGAWVRSLLVTRATSIVDGAGGVTGGGVVCGGSCPRRQAPWGRRP